MWREQTLLYCQQLHFSTCHQEFIARIYSKRKYLEESDEKVTAKGRHAGAGEDGNKFESWEQTFHRFNGTICFIESPQG